MKCTYYKQNIDILTVAYTIHYEMLFITNLLYLLIMSSQILPHSKQSIFLYIISD